MARIERPHWSFSSINQYLRCPLQFYFERIAKIPRTSVPSGLVFGSAMHDALEHFQGPNAVENQTSDENKTETP